MYRIIRTNRLSIIIALVMVFWGIPHGSGAGGQANDNPAFPDALPPLPADFTMRIVISGGSASTPYRHHETVQIVGSQGLRLTAIDGDTEVDLPPETTITATRSPDGIQVATVSDDESEPTVWPGGVLVRSPDPETLLGIASINRPKSRPYPHYRGTLEVLPAPAPEGMLVINTLLLEDYVRAIVPNEMPHHFPMQALQAQAVTVRAYALSNLDRFTHFDADLCDGYECQVYYGALAEEDSTNAAVEATAGLIATYNHGVINAVYFSTTSGHTESSKHVWSSGSDFPGSSIPYLTGVPDDPSANDLRDEEVAQAYIAGPGHPDDFDRASRHYRWEERWSREELESVLGQTLVQRSLLEPEFVQPRFTSSQELGQLVDLRPAGRGVSGRLLHLEIETTEGTWTVSKELNIRYTLRPSQGLLLRSAAVVFDLVRDEEGNLLEIIAHGAGSGHGAGMSQWGAHGMAEAGAGFIDILHHYYQGIAVATPPIALAETADVYPLTQVFMSPSGYGRLRIENHDAQGLEVQINDEVVLVFDLEEAAGFWHEENIDEYLSPGRNRIEIHGPSRGTARISVAVR